MLKQISFNLHLKVAEVILFVFISVLLRVLIIISTKKLFE